MNEIMCICFGLPIEVCGCKQIYSIGLFLNNNLKSFPVIGDKGHCSKTSAGCTFETEMLLSQTLFNVQSLTVLTLA